MCRDLSASIHYADFVSSHWFQDGGYFMCRNNHLPFLNILHKQSHDNIEYIES